VTVARRFLTGCVALLALLVCGVAHAQQGVGPAATRDTVAQLKQESDELRAAIERDQQARSTAHAAALQRAAELEDEIARLEATRTAIEQQPREAKATPGAQAPEAPSSEAPTASTTSPADWARLTRVAHDLAEQLGLHLLEVPGSDDVRAQVGRLAADLDESAPSPRTVASIAALLDLVAEQHHDATSANAKPARIWDAHGRARDVTLLSVGHAAFGYTSKDGEVALAYHSAADATGIRWSAQLDERSAAAARAAIDGASAGATVVRLPLDVSGSLRADSASGVPTWRSRLEAGGLVMIPLLAVAFVALLLIAERVFVLYRLNPRHDQVLERVLAPSQRGAFDEASRACTSLRGAVASTLRAVLERRAAGRAAMEDSIQEQLLHEAPKLQRFVGGLAVLAAVSPLLGLLGTVTGIIETFRTIRVFGNANPSLMAGGISEALTTTATGLVIAIPVFLMHSLLKGRVESILSNAEKHAATLLNLVSHDTAAASRGGVDD